MLNVENKRLTTDNSQFTTTDNDYNNNTFSHFRFHKSATIKKFDAACLCGCAYYAGYYRH